MEINDILISPFHSISSISNINIPSSSPVYEDPDYSLINHKDIQTRLKNQKFDIFQISNFGLKYDALTTQSPSSNEIKFQRCTLFRKYLMLDQNELAILNFEFFQNSQNMVRRKSISSGQYSTFSKSKILRIGEVPNPPMESEYIEKTKLMLQSKKKYFLNFQDLRIRHSTNR